MTAPTPRAARIVAHVRGRRGARAHSDYNPTDGSPAPTMSHRLLLRLAPDGALSWRRTHARGAVAGAGSGDPPADVVASAAQIVVLVPTEDVLLTEVALSARSRAQLLKALPYAVEDQLVGSVDDHHVAASAAVAGRVGVAVVARERIAAWLDRLGRAGVRPDVLVPESLALRPVEGGATAMIEDTRACVRLGAWSAFACPPGDLSAWLAHVVPPPKIEAYDFRDAPPLALTPAPAGYRVRQREPLAFLAGGLATLPALNLLEGEFAPRHRRGRGKQAWRVAAGLAAAVVVLVFAGLVAETWRLSREVSRIEALERAAVREAFPDLDPGQLERIDPVQLVRTRIASAPGPARSDSLLGLLGAVAPVLANGSRQVRVRGLDYRAGTLEIALHAPDLAALDLVREQIANLPGLSSEVTSANPGRDGVDGRLRVLVRGGRS